MNRPYTKRSLAFSRVGLTAAVLGAGLMLIGCGGEEEAPAPVVKRAPAPPPPPPPPSVIPVDELMQEMGIDDRVVMTEERAPETTEERRAVLAFFDAFARGDSNSVMQMLSFIDKAELIELVDNGEWKNATDSISMIEVTAGSLDGQSVALALFETNDGYQPQLWYYNASETDSEFEAAPTPPDIIDRLSGDWIVSWASILEEEIMLAAMPDAELTEIEEDETIASSGGGATAGGSAPGGAPGLRDPTGPPRKAPGR